MTDFCESQNLNIDKRNGTCSLLIYTNTQAAWRGRQFQSQILKLRSLSSNYDTTSYYEIDISGLFAGSISSDNFIQGSRPLGGIDINEFSFKIHDHFATESNFNKRSRLLDGFDNIR
ncbi:885_t:CDS:2 [Funneliformis mosseae]|uniref:885_t:CDS:1 n=1 Tax=Funneliformis mosseae TaxID=27381 RepID=A0A9N9HSS9_FUNMO|nr:885_t:CDS:2 [Funneliformis mosseae]